MDHLEVMLVGRGYTSFERVSEVIREDKKNKFITTTISQITDFLNVYMFGKCLCCFSR